MNNVQLILSILISLDVDSTIKIIISKIDDIELPNTKKYQLLPFLLINNNELSINHIKNLLSKEDALATNMLQIIINNGFSEEYVDFILYNTSENFIYIFLCQICNNFIKLNNIKNKILNIKNLDSRYTLMFNIINLNILKNIEKAEIIFEIWLKSEPEGMALLNNYFKSIKNNKEYIDEFKTLYNNKYANKIDINLFFFF